MNSGSPDSERPITRHDLESLFTEAEKPEAEFRIGGEAEKFGVYEKDFVPLVYEGPRGVAAIFDSLVREHGWKPEAETEGGPTISLVRNGASITLEPGAQFELSGAPHRDVHAVDAEMRAHLRELSRISKELGIAWLGVGFHPLATQEDLPWVPKHRYGVMKRYLPERGTRGLDMMRRTATAQTNFDYSSEDDAMQKLVVLLKLSPLIHAMTANSPFIEGHVSSRKSERGDVWLHMDPSRSGLIAAVSSKTRPRYTDYVEWALDAGMFLFRRGDSFVHNTGQTFRSFLAEGYDGNRATFGDWALHVNTLFPEARLKRTLEMRACDMLPEHLGGAVHALLTGLLYDRKSLDAAAELVAAWSPESLSAARPALVTSGLAASLAGVPARTLAERVIELASQGLARRDRRDENGKDERVHLHELSALVERGECPADVLIRGLSVGEQVAPVDMVARTHI
ncbi:MAG TPA: glutamate-cysteine ligase family protein [Polyangiaceae bacterium]